MSNKSRVEIGLITLPGHPFVMVNENSNNLTTAYPNGSVVTQNNAVSNPSPTPVGTTVLPTLSLMGHGY